MYTCCHCNASISHGIVYVELEGQEFLVCETCDNELKQIADNIAKDIRAILKLKQDECRVDHQPEF